MALWKNKKNEESEPAEQATTPGLTGARHIVAIASGKGGVGKSTVATNLAVSLANRGAQVGLMDADIYGPSQPGMLGALEEKPVADAYGRLIPAQKHGIHFVSMGLLAGPDAPVVWRAPIAIKMIQQFLANVQWGRLDYLLIDLPPGTGDIQLTLAQRASLTGAIIVSTPQDVALGIAKKGLKMFQQVRVPIIGVVENMSGFICEHCGKETPVFKTGGAEKMAKEEEVFFLGKIPLSPDIMASGDNGIPVAINSQDSLAAKAYESLAENVQQRIEQMGEDSEEPKNMEIAGGGTLHIDWPDEHKGIYSAYHLRNHCSCAVCVSENTGQKILDPRNIPLDIRLTGVNKVGRYAINVSFSDGHNTGIYPFTHLRKLCECNSCVAGRSSENQAFSV